MDLNAPQKKMLFKFCAYGFLKNLRFFEPFLLLFFTVEKGLSYTQFGILVGIREVAITVLEVPTGIIADVKGRRLAMVMAFASYLVSFAIFSLAGSFWFFVPAMILFGIGEAFRSGTHKSMIMQHLDLEGLSHLKVDYYGTTRSMSRLGSAVAVIASGIIVFVADSYQIVFVGSMIPYVLGLLLMFTYPRELDGELGPKGANRALLRHAAVSLRNICRTKDVLKALLNTSTSNSFFKVAKDYLQPILETAAVSMAAAVPFMAFADTNTKRATVLISAVYFAIHLNEFFSSRCSGRVAKKVGNMGEAINVLFGVFAAAFFLAGLCLFVSEQFRASFVGSVSLVLAVLLLFLFYTINNLRMPIITGFLSEKTDSQQRATVLSVLSQLRAMVAAVVAPVLGLIADRLGIPAAFLAGGIVLVVAGFFLRVGTDSDEPVSGTAG